MGKSSYRWYEKLFYRLVLKERFCFKLVILLTILLVICQGILTIPFVRKRLLLVEKYEGDPVKFYKSLRVETCKD